MLLLFANVDLTFGWDIKWIDQFGNGLTTATGGGGGTTDAAGVYVGGTVIGALPGQIAAGNQDAYLRKYSLNGALSWTSEFGAIGIAFASEVEGIATDATGVYVAGATTGALPGQNYAGLADAFVRKYDASGSLLWTQQFGTSGFDALLIGEAIAAQGSAVYVGGYTFGTFPGQPAGTGQDFFVAKLDAQTGTFLWLRQFGVRGEFENVGSITADDTGVYLVGNLYVTTAVGNTFTGLLRKYDFDGNLVWAREFNNGSLDCGLENWGVAVHADQIFLIGQANIVFVDDPASCGPGHSASVGSLQKYDPNGNLIWARRIQAGARDGRDGFTGAKTIRASDSGIYVGANATVPFAGSLLDTPRSDRAQCLGLAPGNAFADKLDAYVRRYDFDGNVVWTHQFGSNVFDLVTGIGTDTTHVYVAGDTSCSIASGVPFSGGNRDAFILQMTIVPTSIPGQLQLIIGQIESLADRGRLVSDNFTMVVAQIETALRALQNENTTAARQALIAFTSVVQALINRGDLSSQEGYSLTSNANAIMGQL
jgi:hypothetical protein